MFRQRVYTNTEDNSLNRRLEQLTNNDMMNYKIRFWDIKHETWIDCDDLMNHKIQKEVQIDGELIFYIYKGELKDGK